ncbi:MAG: serine--tRNA ligase [Thermoprotei archaeon]
MLDFKTIHKDPVGVRENIARRHKEQYLSDFDALVKVDEQFRRKQRELDNLRSEHNKMTRKIAEAMNKGGDVTALQSDASKIVQQIGALESEVRRLGEDRMHLVERVPNLLDPSVPDGLDESNNVVVKTAGQIREAGFPLKSHVDLLESLDLADLERAAKIAGARHYFLKNDLVFLDFALSRFALDLLTKKGFTPIVPPEMMRADVYRGVTPLADFADVMYKVQDEDEYLIATSEHPLVAMHADELFEETDLPLRYVGYSVNFRKEAGAHGKDTKGIFRVHTFNKVEQVVFCKPDDSPKMLTELLANAEEIFSLLGIPYRVIEICSGDISPKNARQFDIEAWMPAQRAYREVVSTSNCTSYQAASLGIRYRAKATKQKEYVHTLNSTAVATTRTLVAILENFQTSDGRVKIPDVLVSYMNGREYIEKRTQI